MCILKKIFEKKKVVEPVKQWVDPIVNAQCEKFETNNWITSDFIVKNLYPIVGVHPFPLTELNLMVSSVCYFKPTHIFEWGTHHGKSARIFYEITKAFDIKSDIHSIDLPDEAEHVEHPHEYRGYLVKDISEVKLHQGDGLDVSLDIYKNDSLNSRPLFFLDGDHEYSSVKRELDGILKNVKNPIILAHDTFYQSPESGYNVGPHNAIQEFLDANSEFVSISTDHGLPGMTLIYKK